MNKSAFFLIEYQDAGHFFLRFASAISTEYKIKIITTLPSIHNKAKTLGYSSHLIAPTLPIPSPTTVSIPNINIRNTKAVALGGMSEKTALRRAETLYRILENQTNSSEESYLFIWNGCSISGEVARALKSKKKTRTHTLYFEISNIPGKTFVDSKGTNAQSFIYDHPEFIDQYQLNEENYSAWKADYIKTKEMPSFSPPQASTKKITAGKLADFTHAIISRNFFFGKPLSKIRKVIFKKTKIPDSDVLPSDYAFLPLQVSDDSQIIINSDINNIEAINMVSKKEKSIIIKPHPAEHETNYIKEALKSLCNTYISSGNTFKLITNAHTVYTINSTVGLESLILEKKTIFLGRTFYSKLNSERIKKYIQCHLINIDFFSSENTSTPECLRAINIVKAQEEYAS